MGDPWAEFVSARLDEWEAAAAAATEGGPWSAKGPYDGDPEASFVVREDGHDVAAWVTSEEAAHIAMHDPAGVLRQVVALRAIVAEHEADHEADHGPEYYAGLWFAISEMAAIWAGHPGHPGREGQK